MQDAPHVCKHVYIKVLIALEEAKSEEANSVNTTEYARYSVKTSADKLSVDHLLKVEESVIATRYVNTEPQVEQHSDSRAEPKPTNFLQRARQFVCRWKSGGSVVEPLIQKE